MADTNTPLQWLAEVEAECHRERDELRAGFDNERSTLLARIRELRAENERLRAALNVEHEIQRQMLERLGIEWTPGEPFYSLVEHEITRWRTGW